MAREREGSRHLLDTKSERPVTEVRITGLCAKHLLTSDSHETPQWSPDETPDWALAGEDSPRCSFDSHVSFEIETPADYIHLSDLIAARNVFANDSASDSGSSASRLS